VKGLTEISRKAAPSRSLPFEAAAADIEAADLASLGPEALDLLSILAARPGLTVSRDHLIEIVWGQASDGVLIQVVHALRRALRDDERAPRFIETVAGFGYRWIFDEPPKASPSMSPRWLPAGGAAITVVMAALAGGFTYAWVQPAQPERPDSLARRAFDVAALERLSPASQIDGVPLLASLRPCERKVIAERQCTAPQRANMSARAEASIGFGRMSSMPASR